MAKAKVIQLERKASPLAFSKETAEIFYKLLDDAKLLERCNNHPGSRNDAIRDILVPEAKRRGYKVESVVLQ